MPEGCHSALQQDPMGEECAQLRSPLSASEHDQACVDGRPDSLPRLRRQPSEGSGRRPVSLVSTLSSDSSRDGHSLFGSTAALLPPATAAAATAAAATAAPRLPGEEDVDLQLSPSQGFVTQEGRRSPGGRWGEQREPAVSDPRRNNFHAERTSGRRKAAGGGGGELPQGQYSPVAADAMAPNPGLSYVDRVVMEIIETERMYVRDLRSIVEDYLAQIIDAGDLPILPEQVCALFGNIDDIYVFNSELLQSLDLCENDPVAIARCFVDKSEDFEIYTQYCTNYPNSVAALTECMRSKTLAKFFRDRQASLKRSLPLGSYLLKPVQRILKYHLLLEEIARHYDPEEMGYEVIQEAIDTMTGVAWYINDMKRKHEHAVRRQEIQSLLINWKGPDLTTCGELVLEGSFHVQRAKNSRTLFLFQKMLLITKKRGEHYVCKTHISCSTLMLLDSAKDPLIFSVIHFKHPKQPHTVQAKSMEEKRLWAHHIKRLILENHNAIVPQRAKETIVEMDSVYAGKYRYSPERLKKAESCHADDFPVAGRAERRRSEPAKQILRSTKGFLKHADSEGTLLGDLCSLQPASSVSTLASSVGEPQAEGPGVEEEEEEEEEQEQEEEDVEEQSPKRHSPEQLCPSDVEPPLGSAPGVGGLEEKAEEEVEEEEGDCYKEDILMGDDQDVQSTEEEKVAVGDASETSRDEPPPRQKAEEGALHAQVNLEEGSSSHCEEEPEEETMLVEENHSLVVPDSPASPGQPGENPENPENAALDIREQPHVSTLNGDDKEAESDGSSLRPADGSFLSFSEYSEEDEEMVVDHTSAVPSSALDGAIAQRLTGGAAGRSSPDISEDPRCAAGPSPQPESPRASEKPSVCSDLWGEASAVPGSAPPEPQPAVAAMAAAEGSRPASPAVPEAALEEALGDAERRSTLSKQDRLLIHKIRRYYEHQDASCSIKRRESLSYIPAGLVRQLSKQLNSAPEGQPAPVQRKGSTAGRPTSWSVFDLPGLEKSHGAEPVPKPRRRQRSSEASDASSAADEDFRPSSEMLRVWTDMEAGMNGRPEELPAFDRGDRAAPPGPGPEETGLPGHIRSDEFNGGTRDRSLHMLEECDPEPLSEQSSISPPSTPLTGSESECAEDPWPSAAPRSFGRVARPPLPRIISLRSGMEDDQILQDMGKMKNKVFQLARQYSQRIKNNRPLIRQRNRDSENGLHGLKSMPAVHEESTPSRDNSEHNLTYPLNTYDQVNAVGEPPTPTRHPSPGPGSRAATPQAASSPSSPSPAPSLPGSPVDSEAFHWPDVHELRSRYAGPGSPPPPSPSGPGGHPRVGRSCSVPDRMLELCGDGSRGPPWTSQPAQHLQNHHNHHHHHHHHLPWDCLAESQRGVTPRRRSPSTEGGGGGGGGGSQPARRRLCRWSSLDSMPVPAATATLPLHEVQNLQDPVRTGLGTPPGQHNKLLVVDRVPRTPAAGEGGRTAGEQEVTTAGGDDGGGVPKRPAAVRGNKNTESKIVKNLREKFQSLSSGS